MSQSAVKVAPILGTMTFGAEGQIKPDSVGPLLRTYLGTNCTKTPQGALIDTARIYQQRTPDGDTETTLGEAFDMSPSMLSRISMATKADGSAAPHFSLSRASVIDQCNTSLEKLGIDCVDLFYLHSPDIKTDINDTLDGIQELHTNGKIKEFGLSNYPAWAVVDIWHRCNKRGMILPTVYQGMYNVITRDMEREIIPVVREFNMRLHIYNPLAGGLLAGKYSKLEDVTGASVGRFSEEFDGSFGSDCKAGTVGYCSRYANKFVMEGVSVLMKACLPLNDASQPSSGTSDTAIVQDTVSEIDGKRVRVIISETANKLAPQGLDMANVALRWLIYHSCLGSGDGVILGVSKSSHLVANLAAWQSGPLPLELIQACQAAWKAAQPGCPSYFCGYDRFLAFKAQQQECRDFDEMPAKKAKVPTS